MQRLAAEGIKSVDVMCPGFVADCLETLEEISIEARAAFMAAGGQDFRYVRSLNDAPQWIGALADLAERELQGWPTQRGGETGPAQDSARQRKRALGMGAPD